MKHALTKIKLPNIYILFYLLGDIVNMSNSKFKDTLQKSNAQVGKTKIGYAH